MGKNARSFTEAAQAGDRGFPDRMDIKKVS